MPKKKQPQRRRRGRQGGDRLSPEQTSMMLKDMAVSMGGKVVDSKDNGGNEKAVSG